MTATPRARRLRNGPIWRDIRRDGVQYLNGKKDGNRAIYGMI